MYGNVVNPIDGRGFSGYFINSAGVRTFVQKQFFRMKITAMQRHSVAGLVADSQSLISSLTDGNSGGSAGMNLWSPSGLYDNESTSACNAFHNARDPGSGTKYAFNPNLWCTSLLPQLTCCVVFKDDCGTSWSAAGQAWRARYGGVAITKRHVLYCSHAFTHAQGTWINGNTTNSPPTRLRFIDQNGDRIRLQQCSE
jgi:hypothetical protein